MIKAVKIKETFKDFLEEHPELTPVYDIHGNLEKVIFPDNATNISFSNILGNVKIYYRYNGNNFYFSDFEDETKED